MTNYAVLYTKKIDEFLKEKHSSNEIIEMTSTHLTRIGFFQHERLIHLIVTVLFAILDMAMIIISFFTFNISCILLMFFFTLLLVPYIFHYYFLENSVQKMYKQYEELLVKTI